MTKKTILDASIYGSSYQTPPRSRSLEITPHPQPLSLDERGFSIYPRYVHLFYLITYPSWTHHFLSRKHLTSKTPKESWSNSHEKHSNDKTTPLMETSSTHSLTKSSHSSSQGNKSLSCSDEEISIEVSKGHNMGSEDVQEILWEWWLPSWMDSLSKTSSHKTNKEVMSCVHLISQDSPNSSSWIELSNTWETTESSSVSEEHEIHSLPQIPEPSKELSNSDVTSWSKQQK